MGYNYILQAILLLFFFSFNTYSQVGIGNTDPDGSSLLDIRDGNGDKGILIPQVNIPNLNSAAPVDSPLESLLVYNTNTATGKGYVYWNGSGWQSFGSSSVKIAYEKPNFLNSHENLSSPFGGFVYKELYQKTITLAKPTLVEINTLITVAISTYPFDNEIANGKTITYGLYVTAGSMLGPEPEFERILSEFRSFSSIGGSSAGENIGKYYTLGGDGYIDLPAGTHDIIITVVGNGVGPAFKFTYGNEHGAHFKIIYHN